MIGQDMTRIQAQPVDNRSPWIRSALRRTAFTLMEMLLVVAIIVALAGIGGYHIFNTLNDAKRSASMTQKKALQNAAEQYYMSHNDWPPSLQALTESTGGRPAILKKDAKLKDDFGADFVGSFDASLNEYVVDSVNTRK